MHIQPIRMTPDQALIAHLRRKIAVLEADLAAVTEVQPTRTPMRVIVAQVAAEYEVLPEDLRGRSRLAEFVAPRFEAYRRCRDAGFSYPKIGQFFGRDHTSVLYGVRVATAKGTE